MAEHHTLFNVWKLRGGEFFDVPHRRVRSLKLAISRAGLSCIEMEMSICFGYLLGPFHSESNVQTCLQLATEIFAAFDSSFEVYRLLYEAIVDDRYGAKLPAGYGSEGHVEQLWKELPGTRCIDLTCLF